MKKYILFVNSINDKKEKSRILVFSEYDNSFENINKFLTENKINFSVTKNFKKSIMQILRDIKSSGIKENTIL